MDYALIKTGTVQNVIVADEQFIAQIAAEWDHIERIDTPAEQSLGVGIGWGWDGTQFVAPPVPLKPPAPPEQRHMAPASFKRRLSQPERIGIRQAAKVSDEVYDFMDLLDTSKFIDLDDPLTQYGLQQLEAAGLLAAGRADEILNAPVLESERP